MNLKQYFEYLIGQKPRLEELLRTAYQALAEEEYSLGTLKTLLQHDKQEMACLVPKGGIRIFITAESISRFWAERRTI